MAEEDRGQLRGEALVGHIHIAVDPLAAGRLDMVLVPEMLSMRRTVTEMDACGARRNDGVRRENDAAGAGQGMIPVAELANEEPLAERAANEEAVDAKEPNFPERLLNSEGKHHATLAVDLHTYLCTT